MAARLIHFFRSRFVRFLLFALLLLTVLFLIRFPLLKALGNYLSIDDPVGNVDVLYVLGGSSFDRGVGAAEILKAGHAPKAVFLGEMVPTYLRAIGDTTRESELTREACLRAGISEDKTELLPIGTSTFEEFNAIMEDVDSNGYERIMILSNTFHLRRMRSLTKPLRNRGVEVVLRGAPNSSFDETLWWRSEEGLIMLNNEYTKLLYYWWKY